MQIPHSLAFKNAIVYFGLFLVGFGLLGFLLLYYSSKEIILGEEQSIAQSADLIELKVQEHLSELKQDIKFLSSGPLLNEFFRTQDSNTLEYIKLEFLALLDAKSDYDQIRFISAQEKGKEIVRVDRKANTTSIVPDDSLQIKGDREYYQEAIGLPEDALYFSPIDLNKEFGKISMPITPTIRAAYPVYYNQVVQGIVIVNMNLNDLFQSLNQIVSNNAQLRIANQDGYYLFHENKDSTFLFEYNQAPNIDPTSFNESIDIFQSSDRRIEFQKKLEIPDIEYALHLIMITDKDKLLANYYKWRRTSISSIALLAILFMVLSFLILRRQSTTLQEITKNLLQFPISLKTENLPTNRKDEIGKLASGFEQMSNMITQNMKSLEDAKTVAQQAVNDKDEFIENFSHEIRNPLQSIIGLCHVLDQNNPTPAQKNIVNSLRFNTSNLNILINDILDYKKVINGQIQIHYGWIKLADFIDELFKSNSYFALSKQLDFQYHLDESLAYSMINTDALRLSQILNNLITNAIKFTPQKGQIQFNIEKKENEAIYFSLTNSGNPIPKEEIDKIQERYYRAENHAIPNSGHGIGLSIVQSLLGQFGSKLEITAQDQTTFAFLLPCQIQTDKKILDEQKQDKRLIDEKQVSMIELDAASILVIEDDRQILQLYKHIFENLEEQVQYIYSLDKIDELKRSFDVVLMDFQMGSSSVLEKQNEIKSLLHPLSIVYLVSGQTILEDQLPDEFSIDRVLLKPFDASNLLSSMSDDYCRKNFGSPQFQSIMNDYDHVEEKYNRAIQLLFKEWNEIKPQLRSSIEYQDNEKFQSIHHKIITTVRRLELDAFEQILEDINLAEINSEEAHRKAQKVEAIMDQYLLKIQVFLNGNS